MKLDNIKELIEKEEIGAITIDTSVFDAQGLRLESGLLKQLEQFSDSPIEVILSEVVKNEILRHIEEKIKNTYVEVEKALKNAKNYCQLEEENINNIKASIFKGKEPKVIASERLDKFIKITPVEIVEVQDYVEAGKLLEKYFQSKPPFAKAGDKKSEFPDAMALMSLESWAEENMTKVLVISKDNDWKQYCEQCENLIFFDDFSKAFELFQLPIEPHEICKQLSQKYRESNLSFIKKAIAATLQARVCEFDLYIEAESSYQYEDEVIDIDYEKFEFNIIENPDIIFRPINYDKDSLVVEAELKVEVRIECGFYFMTWDSIDKEYIGMGAANLDKKVTLDVDVLVTLVDETGRFDNNIEVDEVEVITTKETIDFGYIEPDWMSGDDYD
ncbi:hypothetical protein CAL7716_105900 (plasmid) [Calothrix sp. PCC 7716]|nr:hypothetical protein CAL7716_105900 [Calothrix sp. PCC 7716]